MVVKRIIYLTTINLNSKRAQSLQVKKFVKSLTNTTNKKQIEFKAFSLGSVPEEYKNYFKSPSMKLFKNRLLNNLYMIYYLTKNNFLIKRDILYSRDLLLLFIFSLFGFKTVYELHHPGVFRNRLFFKLFIFNPKNNVVTISNALKNFVLKNNYFFKKEIIVLPSSVDIKKYDNSPSHYSCRDQLGMDMDRYNVVHTGSPYIGRGIEKFIELCKISNQIFFTHIGGTLDEITRLKSLAEKNRVSNCIFLSNLDEKEIIKYQKGANLLFYVITKKWPTYWCCSPLKIPEYMASGTPILASAVGSITEFLDDENSFLFYSDNNSLKKQLLEAKLNPKLSLHKASLARKKVEKFYTYDIRSESLIHYLNNL